MQKLTNVQKQYLGNSPQPKKTYKNRKDIKFIDDWTMSLSGLVVRALI